jgi:chromosome segregation ATPase
MCAGHEEEIELVKQELCKVGIAAVTRRHPIAEALGASGVELWVQNEQDFSNASRLYNRLQGKAADSPKTAPSPKAETSGASGSGPKPQPEPAGNPPKDGRKVESVPVVQPRCVELKEASSQLQKGIEQMLMRESELTGECTSLHGKVEELTRALAQAQADVIGEIKNREAAEQNQTTRLNSLLDTLERERREWQQKLKSSDDACKHAKEQAGSLSRLLQTQQAAVTALKEEAAARELHRDQQEQALSDARQAAVAEREARVAAEERASRAEESLQTQRVESQELEQQIQAHATSLSSLLARVTSKAAGITGEP